MSFKRVLVTGSDGQLGRSLLKMQDNFTSLILIHSDIQNLDITKNDDVQTFLTSKNIDYVINCAAYTAVDKAEQFEKVAFSINHLGAKVLAENCKSLRIPLIHISTDYVFSGTNNIPYKESDTTGPLTAYGRSKLAGEISVLDSGVYGLIIRTSWLYSEYGGNFVKSMMRIGREREELGVVFDQTGSPTYAGDLAQAILTILNGYLSGHIVVEKTKIFHYCNTGICSWYDFAKAVMEISDINCSLHPISTEEFPLPAMRPHYSVLNSSLIREKFGVGTPYWRNSLSKCIEQLKK